MLALIDYGASPSPAGPPSEQPEGKLGIFLGEPELSALALEAGWRPQAWSIPLRIAVCTDVSAAPWARGCVVQGGRWPTRCADFEVGASCALARRRLHEPRWWLCVQAILTLPF